MIRIGPAGHAAVMLCRKYPESQSAAGSAIVGLMFWLS